MSEQAFTQISTHDDGKFMRTALVVGAGEKGGSVAIVNAEGERIALLNIFTNEDNSWFAVDVIDIEEQFDKRTALVFNDGQRRFLEAENWLIAADFRMKAES